MNNLMTLSELVTNLKSLRNNEEEKGNLLHLDDSETLKARTLLLRAQEKVILSGPGWHPAITYAEDKW